MKRFIILCFAFMLFFVPALVLASSCDSGGEADYFVKFTFEGEEYVCSFGHPDGEVNVPYAAVVTPAAMAAAEYIEFFGGSWDSDAVPEEPSFAVEVEGVLVPSTPGTYTGEYDLSMMPYVEVFIWDDPDYYIYDAASGTLTIDSFGDVGEAVTGTFDATFEIFPILELGDPTQEITGSFRVKRIDPEDLPPEVNSID